MKKILIYIAFLCLSNVYSQCFTTIGAGYSHSIGLKPNGTLWAWGMGLNGQIGIGNENDQYVPIQMGNDSNWAKFFGGYSNTFAIKNDGSLWGTGYNVYGALGIGSTAGNTTVFTQVGTANNWMEVATGQSHTIGLRTDHTMWAWGYGDFGQTGHDPNSTYGLSQFNQIPGLWSAMAVGGDKFSMGIKTDGTLWAWGNNNIGQLGNGTTNNTHIPVQVGTDSNWVSVSCGYIHTIALKSDGSLWAWGDNMFGELGDGTTNSTTTPHVVPIAGCTLSTDEFATTKPLLKVYPNPVKEDLDFSYTGNEMITTVVVYDLSGREVYISHPVVSTNLKATIKLGMLSSGSYILCLKNKEHTVISQKIIKE